jgi:hypothetical protein
VANRRACEQPLAPGREDEDGVRVPQAAHLDQVTARSSGGDNGTTGLTVHGRSTTTTAPGRPTVTATS